MGGACFSFRKKWLKGKIRYIIDYLRQTGRVQTTFIRGSCTPTNGEHITAQYVGGACFSFRKKWLKGKIRYIIDYLRQTGRVQTTFIRGSCTPTNGEHITVQYVGGVCFSFRKKTAECYIIDTVYYLLPACSQYTLLIYMYVS